MSEAGKGSGARPFSVSKEQFSNNWDAIFGKKEKHSECGGECNICFKNPNTTDLIKIQEPSKE